VQADSPEMRRVYEVASEFRVPVLLHFEKRETSTPGSPGCRLSSRRIRTLSSLATGSPGGLTSARKLAMRPDIRLAPSGRAGSRTSCWPTIPTYMGTSRRTPGGTPWHAIRISPRPSSPATGAS
jgi:hypothetical protein